MAGLVFLITSFAQGQNSQFLFDSNGNLLVQTPETSALPQIIGQPQNRIIAPGEATSFLVVAANTRALTYQWKFNGSDINGATDDALLLQNVSAGDEGEYRVVLTNPSGSVTSAPALLMIDSDGDGLPDSWERSFFNNLTQNSTADFDGDGVSNLQEFLDGTNPTNRASVQFRLTIYTDGGGVVDFSPSQLSYTNGQTVTLTATPLAPNVFHAWTGEIVTRSNPITLTMTNNKTVKAFFFPINFVWTNFADGDWNTAANWMPSLVPGSNDNVTINRSATVTLNTPADCNDVTLGANSPTLTGSGNLTVRGNLSWLAGTMSGSGRTILEPGATMTIASLGQVNLNARILENGGTALWTGAGNIVWFGGAVITNRPGALFQVQNAASFNFFSGADRFDNAGTFRKSVSAGETFVGIAFNNYGAVDVQTGTLSLGGGGTHSGSLQIQAGAALTFSGGTYTANGSSDITGTGNLGVSAGTANLSGLVNVSGSNTFSGGTANFTGDYICTNNTVTISGAAANFNGTGSVSPAVVNLSNGTLDGNNTVTIKNTMNWTGGDMVGSGRTIISTGATLNISNLNIVVLRTRTLENGGTALWMGTGNLVLDKGVLTNRAGALFQVQGDGSFSFNGNESGRIDNAGTFRKSNTGTTDTGVIGFNNFGAVDLRSGILAVRSYVSSPGALLNCALDGTTAGTGYGQLQVSGNVTLAGNLSVTLANNFVPPVNSLYTVLTAGSRSGSFANFSYPSNEVTAQLSYTPNSAFVRVTDVSAVPQSALAPAGLISWWRAEGNALDTFGTNHGVLTNGAAFAAGQVGQTFALDGADDYVQVPDSQTLRPASVTIEAWVKFFATNGIRIVLVKPLGNNTTFDSYGLALQDGAVLAAICDNGGFGPFLTGPANTVPGQWYHLAYTFDDSSKQQVLYVNGVPVASGTANKTISYDTHPLLLGADVENGTLSFFHNGLIDEASLYNRALTSDEVATIYNAGAMGKQLGVGIPPPMLLTPEISGTDFKLTWTVVPSVTYRVEFNPDLTISNWTALPGDVIGVSDTATKLEPLPLSNRFYRVRVLP